MVICTVIGASSLDGNPRYPRKSSCVRLSANAKPGWASTSAPRRSNSFNERNGGMEEWKPTASLFAVHGQYTSIHINIDTFIYFLHINTYIQYISNISIHIHIFHHFCQAACRAWNSLLREMSFSESGGFEDSRMVGMGLSLVSAHNVFWWPYGFVWK